METIGNIASIVAAIMAIATLWFTIRNSRKSIIRRIEKKECEIHCINNQLIRMFGVNGRGIAPLTKLDDKKERLENEVNSLRQLL